ncbi:MAG: hypothetical protein ABSF10_06975, partial [Verrucomicrobiota bacterium]
KGSDKLPFYAASGKSVAQSNRLKSQTMRHKTGCGITSVCGSATALRSGSVPAVSPPALHFFRSPTADRSLIKIEEQQSLAVHINLGCVVLSEVVK